MKKSNLKPIFNFFRLHSASFTSSLYIPQKPKGKLIWPSSTLGPARRKQINGRSAYVNIAGDRMVYL